MDYNSLMQGGKERGNPMNLYRVLWEAARINPHVTAIATQDESYTYAELITWVEQLASGFRRLGVRPGNRVVLLLRNRPTTFAVFWAVIALGAVAVPINADQSRETLRRTLQDVEPQAIIYEALEGRGIAGLTGSERPLLIGVGADDADIEIGELPHLAKVQPEFRFHEREADDVALILYTTGTTGQPKGVPRTHLNTLSAAQAHVMQNCYELRERILGVMPLSHTMGLHLYIAATLLSATYVVVRDLDPDQAAELIDRQRVSALYQTPFWYYILLHSQQAEKYEMRTVRKIGYAGQVMHESLIEASIDRFHPQVFKNHYGSTEVYTHTISNVLARIPGSVGQAGNHSLVTIDGSRVAGTVGEVLVSLSSPEAFRGYWNRPDLTRRQLDGGWYRTRDLGYQDAEGNFYVVGRIDDMIISGGEHILPQIVESVLANHPKILEVAVTGEPDNRWGQIVVAYVVPRTAGLRVFELDAYCKQQSVLSLWARPRKYVFVRQIPKSATGKIIRRELTNLEGSL